jgi:hypothetical protein
MGFPLEMILKDPMPFNDLLDCVDMVDSASPSGVRDLISKVRERTAASLQRTGAPLPIPVSPLPANADAALQAIERFNDRTGALMFSNLSRQLVAAQLVGRVCRPSKINQKNQPLCGPNSFLHGVIQRSVVEYVEFATRLAELGTARLREFEVKPDPVIFKALQPPDRGIFSPPCEADLIVLAGLRSSSVLNYELDNIAVGYTEPGILYEWMVRAGFADVMDRTLMKIEDMPEKARGRPIHTGINQGVDQVTKQNLSTAKHLADLGYKVIMLAHVNLTKNALAESVMQDGGLHWTLVNRMQIMLPAYVVVDLWSWGSRSSEKQVQLPLKEFMSHYRGFVAGRP